ncbi:hypothetical protein HYU23_03285 [Candidatus Woesearchaeota archaeon]|nr:hypothetical protein [Candidatus Woesearchaeota archaeon]
MNPRKVLAYAQIFLVLSLIFSLVFSFNTTSAYAQESVCCEKDNSGNFCSYVPTDQCTSPGVLKAATSCDQTSFCKPGCCAGVNGFCYANYPKALCEKGYKGSYSTDNTCSSVAECKIGCCIIGTQAAYLTRNRCIQETSKFPDLEVDFRDNVGSEQECLNLAKNTEKGCCVSADRRCKYGAKSECNVESVLNGTGFYKDTFCSGLRNVCDCAPHNSGDPRATTCLPNDDRVYWKDSCGNPEGIVTGIDLRNYGGARADGNCDYNTGTLCSDSNKDGIYVCERLDCQGGAANDKANNKLSVNMINYKGRGTPSISEEGILNGESWCTFDDQDQNQLFNQFSTADRQGKDPPGSRYYRHLCIGGQELVEPCKDFREEYCYYNDVNVNFKSSGGNAVNKKYTESRCIPNKWQPCVDECNTANPLTMDSQTYKQALEKDQTCCLGSNRDCYWSGSRCVPAVSPGFKFWEGEGSNICAKANSKCTMLFRCNGWNSLFGSCGASTESSSAVGGVVAAAAGAVLAGFLSGGLALVPIAIGGGLSGLIVGLSQRESGWQVLSGGECLSQDYLQGSNNLCRSMGDCGADFNFLYGYGGVDKKFSLSYSGFTNTQVTNKEIYDYALKNPNKIAERKSNPERGNVVVDFEKSGGVPGSLEKIGDPDWTKGGFFFNYNIPKKELSNQFVRALFGQPDIDGQGWLGPAAIGAGVSIVGGIIGGVMFKSAAGFGVGFSSSPLGFLVSKLVGFVFPKTAEKLGLKAAEGTYTQQIAKTAGERAAGAAKDQALKASSKAYEKTLEDAGRKAIEKEVSEGNLLKLTEKTQEEIIKKAQEQAVDKAKEVGTQAYDSTVDNARQAAVKSTEKTAGTFSQVMTGVSAAMWIYTIYQLGDVFLESTQPIDLTTTCQPWQPPVYKQTELGQFGDPCQRCNTQFNPGKEGGYVNVDKTPKDIRAFKTCSEYRCKSLGPTCELVNKGTTEENCVSVSKFDTSSPKIEPWPEVFTLNISAKDIEKTAAGFKVKKIIPIYSPFAMGIKTDEPSQCKMSFQHSKRYNEMENIYFGGNVFNYFHMNTMVYPASKGVNTTGGISLTGGGHYKTYMRCIDASGNANEADYVIEFDVSSEPDLTAPSIVGSSLSPPVPAGLVNQTFLDKEVYLMNGATYTDVTLFVNEPSECRYSYVPLEFTSMNETNSCKTPSNMPDAPPYYSCKFIRGVKGFAGVGPAPSGFVSKAGMAQFVYFKCRDHPEPGYKDTRNFNKEAYSVVLRGSEPLKIDSVGPTGTIKTSGAIVNVTLEVRTSGGALFNGQSICKYTTDEKNKENFAAMTEFLNTKSSLHTQPWTPGSGLQTFYVGCHDDAGNRKFETIKFNVEKDVTAPIITKVYRDQSFQPPQFIIEVNEQSECKDSIDGVFNYDIEGNLMNPVGTGGKVFSSTVPNSNVYYIICRDQFNNTMSPAFIQIAQL